MGQIYNFSNVMTRLSININKFATLRNARGGNNPDLIKTAIDCEQFGAQGITVHPRPDERHIRYEDVIALKEVVTTEFNIEGYPNERFMELVSKVKPEQVTLVPDSPDVLTSNAGWDTIEHKSMLTEIIAALKKHSGRVSIFVEASGKFIEGAAEVGADRVELYTEPYAAKYHDDTELATFPFVLGSGLAHELGLGVNAGHDLDLENLKNLKQNLPFLDEVSIGHALVCDALYYGLENTIQMYLRQLK